MFTQNKNKKALFVRDDGKTLPCDDCRRKAYLALLDMKENRKYAAYVLPTLRQIHLSYELTADGHVTAKKSPKESAPLKEWLGTINALKEASLVYEEIQYRPAQREDNVLSKPGRYITVYRYTDPELMHFICQPDIPPDITYDNYEKERRTLTELSARDFLTQYACIDRKYACLHRLETVPLKFVAVEIPGNKTGSQERSNPNGSRCIVL